MTTILHAAIGTSMSRLAAVFAFALAWTPLLLAQSLRIDSIEPPQGPIAGGTVVTLRGENFQDTNLSVEKVPLTPLAVSATEIRFITPSHDNGIALIKVANASGAAYAEFLYVPPRLDELPPGSITTVAGIGEFTGFYRQATEAQTAHQGVRVFDS